MKYGREVSIRHVDRDGHRYVIMDAPYIDCGKSSEYRYCARLCRCDACTDKHAERNARRYRATRRYDQPRAEATQRS